MEKNTLFSKLLSFFASLILVAARMSDFQQNMNEGDLHLINGKGDYEGNVLVYHGDYWGFICDDDWDIREARVVCRQLGFPGAQKHTYGSFFKRETTREIWMDNVKCTGREAKLTSCPFNGWNNHNCGQREAAGVICIPRPTAIPRPAYAMPKPWLNALDDGAEYKPEKINFAVELEGGPTDSEGFIKVNVKGRKGTICADYGWNWESATVVCREIGKGYAASYKPKNSSQNIYGGEDLDVVLGFMECTGKEEALKDCSYYQLSKSDKCDKGTLATVHCEKDLPDLIPNKQLVQDSIRVEDIPLFYLDCAMEEGCLSSSAYDIVRTVPGWDALRRRLLRFSSSVLNQGTADFRPNLNRSDYQWHLCHLHYHSMAVFAHYDIKNAHGIKMAEGHKASFCLEDSKCEKGVNPKFQCANWGDQGISPGCMDNYYHEIDCQWIDITDLPAGSYNFQMKINPDRLVPEITYDNNDITCDFYYSGLDIRMSNCRYGRE